MWLDPIVRFLIPPVCCWLFLSGLDELFVDLWFAWQAAFGRDSWDVSMPKLDRAPQKRIAMFVPCWRESEVIENMVDHNIAAIDYGNYDIFLGVYPNDPATIEKAALLEARYPNVHKSLCPEPGPTNKADCLNWIFQRMKLQEEKQGCRYDTVVQHDAEDIVHPKSFKLINYLADRYDMIQIPVLPLEMPFHYLTHGTYCDEFAEYQVKDIYTRQTIGGFLPSAGVGTAFRRDALEEIAVHYRNQIFNVHSLTEDYEIGLKFQRHGKSQILVRKAIPLNGNGNGHHRNPYHVEYIATREYFPHSLRAAVRQKSRWVMGVSLQAWDQGGWNAPVRQLYWLWRDRKGLLGNMVTLLSNLIFLYCFANWAAAEVLPTGWTIGSVFPPAGFIWWLIPFNTFFIFERLFYRIYAVNRVYGPAQAAAVILRAPLANVINFVSTLTALATFFRGKLLHQELKWMKTAHAYPSGEQLLEFMGEKEMAKGAAA